MTDNNKQNLINANTLILGIETSCDETAASVVAGDKTILSNIIYSQLKEHEAYGGVVPEIAARSHLEACPWVIEKTIEQAGIKLSDLTCVSATSGPGLIGGILVGMQTAKAISFAQDIPFIGINHLEGHALTARLTDDVSFPFLLLLVSGGHTQILQVNGVGYYTVLGTTLDDAVGEAFDKTAKILGVGYPGGPMLEKCANFGDASKIELPRPMVGKANCDFSFSGLKTRVRHLIEAQVNPTEQYISDMCASFQIAVSGSIKNRMKKAFEIFKQNTGVKSADFVVAGGVASNIHLREVLKNLANKSNFTFKVAPVSLCTDNAVMIAWAGLENYNLGKTSPLNMPARPRWSLESLKNDS